MNTAIFSVSDGFVVAGLARTDSDVVARCNIHALRHVLLIAAEQAHPVKLVEAGLFVGAWWSTTRKTCDVIICKPKARNLVGEFVT